MRALAAALLVMAMNGSCWAGLGGAPADLGPSGVAARVEKKSTGQAAYTDIEKTLESGIVVRQYVDASGTVFAVSWSGPYLPDLKEILGSHFNTMVEQSRRGAKSGPSRFTVNRSDLVIVSGGHMGAFEGRAWLPPKLPEGFKPNDIK